MSRGSVRDGDVTITKCRWVCPICDETSLTLAVGEQPEAAVVRNLTSHVMGTRGQGHGEIDSVPDGFDPDTLTAYVEREFVSAAE